MQPQQHWYERAREGQLPGKSLDERRDPVWDQPHAYSIRDLQAATRREAERQGRDDDRRDAAERAVRQWLRS